MRITPLIICLLLVCASLAAPPEIPVTPTSSTPSAFATPTSVIFGTLASDPAHTPALASTNIRLVTLNVLWSRFAPHENQIDPDYIAQLQSQIAAFRAARMLIVIDPGLQYPPAWVFKIPHSRFVNQYGDTYNQDTLPGKTGLNAVFNQQARDLIAAYLQLLFQHLGTDFFAVRLGGGYFGELHYPDPAYNNHPDSFWCYDDIAQGKSTTPALPPGITVCNHSSDRAFIDWYLDALVNYQNWQITTVRKLFPAPRLIFMLYPSWGTRPGTIDQLVTDQLKFSANTEVHRGNDFARQVAAITDPHVAVYCTWCDSDPSFSNDDSPDPAHWSPMHYLSSLAQQHPLHLQCWAENTGKPNTTVELHRSIDRVRRHKLAGLVWAFEPDLFSPTPAPGSAHHATLSDYARAIAAFKK